MFFYVIGLRVVEMDKFKILVLRILLDKKKTLANVYNKMMKVIAKAELMSLILLLIPYVNFMSACLSSIKLRMLFEGSDYLFYLFSTLRLPISVPCAL